MQRLRRSHVGHLDGFSVSSLFESMRLNCEIAATGELRELLTRELIKLRSESEKPRAEQNRSEIESAWDAIKPELRATGIWRGYDSPLIRARLARFVKR